MPSASEEALGTAHATSSRPRVNGSVSPGRGRDATATGSSMVRCPARTRATGEGPRAGRPTSRSARCRVAGPAAAASRPRAEPTTPPSEHSGPSPGATHAEPSQSAEGLWHGVRRRLGPPKQGAVHRRSRTGPREPTSSDRRRPPGSAAPSSTAPDRRRPLLPSSTRRSGGDPGGQGAPPGRRPLQGCCSRQKSRGVTPRPARRPTRPRQRRPGQAARHLRRARRVQVHPRPGEPVEGDTQTKPDDHTNYSRPTGEDVSTPRRTAIRRHRLRVTSTSSSRRLQVRPVHHGQRSRPSPSCSTARSCPRRRWMPRSTTGRPRSPVASPRARPTASRRA